MQLNKNWLKLQRLFHYIIKFCFRYSRLVFDFLYAFKFISEGTKVHWLYSHIFNFVSPSLLPATKARKTLLMVPCKIQKLLHNQIPNRTTSHHEIHDQAIIITTREYLLWQTRRCRPTGKFLLNSVATDFIDCYMIFEWHLPVLSIRASHMNRNLWFSASTARTSRK